MLLQKDNQIFRDTEIRRLYPHVSFGPNTYAELGYEPVPEEPPPPLTPERIKQELTFSVQRHLDATAANMGYDNIYTACTYADEPAVPLFQQEGQALRAWRSLVWAHCHTVMAAVAAGQRAVPTSEELIAELPALQV